MGTPRCAKRPPEQALGRNRLRYKYPRNRFFSSFPLEVFSLTATPLPAAKRGFTGARLAAARGAQGWISALVC